VDGALIRATRRRLGLTQAGLAARLGVSFVTVNRWERGKSKPPSQILKQLRNLEIQQALAPRADEGLARHQNRPPTGAPDFLGDPERVRLVAEVERLSFGHVASPTFATETSRIEPLPHQRIAVYEHMLSQPRLRFLLADDAGASKTIMAGLYIREMQARRLIRRVLIVPPAGLLGNWERELRRLFEDSTADEEAASSGREGHEPDEDRLVQLIRTTSLVELEAVTVTGLMRASSDSGRSC